MGGQECLSHAPHLGVTIVTHGTPVEVRLAVQHARQRSDHTVTQRLFAVTVSIPHNYFPGNILPALSPWQRRICEKEPARSRKAGAVFLKLPMEAVPMKRLRTLGLKTPVAGWQKGGVK